MKKPKIGVVLVDYKTSDKTLICLNSLSSVLENLEIILVKVQSENDFKQHDLSHPYTQIETQTNKGFASANNMGIYKAIEIGCTHILLLNNDTRVEKDFLKPLLLALDNPKVGVVSPLIYFEKDHEHHKDDYQDSERGKVIWYGGGVIDWKNVLTWHERVNEVDHFIMDDHLTDYATGCAMLFKAEMVTLNGALDENFFMYYEDVDWCVRLKNKGYASMVINQAKIWHANASSGNGAGSKMVSDWMRDSRKRFALKHASARAKLAVLREFYGI